MASKGNVISIPASGIVVGDILRPEAGDLVAADARLLEAGAVTCIEASLTGESMAVKKRP
jgi:Ca2+-transporting ATPase